MSPGAPHAGGEQITGDATQAGGLPMESVFTVEATPLKFGAGASAEAGWELERLGIRRAMVVCDPRVRAAGLTEPILEQLKHHRIAYEVYDQVRVEPTEASFTEAAAAAREGGYDGFLSIGGGSTIDTAKVADLLASHGGSVIEYVNPPVGGGRRPRGPLKPHVAIPTTAGTGAEATTVAVLDLPELRVKSGISHRYLRPAQAIVDPDLSRTMPAAVTSSAGLDVVCHAAESYISRPFHTRPRPVSPAERPPYQGSNPIADLWSARALEYGGAYLRRAVASGDDLEARGFMMLAASLAGIGFGSAGVHIPHACAYPIAGLKHSFDPPGYAADHRFVPHGWSVIVTSPAAFRFTFDANPERHRQVAELLSGTRIAPEDTDAETLPRVLIELMRDIGAPSGIRALGYDERDIPELVQGALKQQRLLVVSPKEPGAEDLARIYQESMDNW